MIAFFIYFIISLLMIADCELVVCIFAVKNVKIMNSLLSQSYDFAWYKGRIVMPMFIIYSLINIYNFFQNYIYPKSLDKLDKLVLHIGCVSRLILTQTFDDSNINM